MEPYLGQIQPFGFYFAPRGWMLCQGQLLSIATNTALFSLLGTTYGGNGQQTFGLPNLAGRVAIGQGSGPGLTPKTIGEMSGTESVTLLSTQMPMHTHVATFTGTGGSAGQPLSVSVKASTQKATQSVPGTAGANTLGACYYNAGPEAAEVYVADPNPSVELAGVAVTGGGGGITGGTVSVGAAGGSQPFGVMQPYLALNYSIAVQGIFPSRD